MLKSIAHFANTPCMQSCLAWPKNIVYDEGKIDLDVFRTIK